ncbi:uncharacterized protein [Nicotiana sylvestris]|uniref:uncharacterized protein n=1 Tax=Nicotiana sylvestris TaxID=4096 RepID=UPI00388CA874
MNSVSNELLGGMVYETSAQKVGADLRESFDKVNGSRILFLHRQIATLSQGISSVSVYFAKLKELWAELDALMPCPGCGCEESKRYAEHFGNHRLLQFLMDLNETYSQSSNQIMMISPTPTINKAYFMIIAEESRRSVVNFAQTSTANEGIAMFSGKGNSQGSRPPTNNGPNSGSFEVAANFAGLQQNNLDSTSQGGQGVIAGVPQFTVDQYNQILHLLGKFSITSSSQSDPPSNAMSAGMTSSFIATKADVRWIVDTGASNHMVKSLKVLEESRNADETSIGKIHLPTRKIASVKHTRSTSVIQGHKITNVLHIPDFKYNFLSVSKLTKELRCLALFYPNFCLFLDLFNERVRGIGKEDEGLYIYISGNKDQTNGGENNNSDSGISFVNTIKDDS